MVVEEFLTYLKKEKRYSIHTLTAYSNDLEEFSNYCFLFFETTISEATLTEIRSWLASLVDLDYSTKSVRRKASSLNSFFKYLIFQSKRDDNPMSLITLPKISKKLPSYLAEKETDLLFSDLQFDNSDEGQRDRLILELLYNTGIRQSELIELKISDIDFAQNQIKVLGKRNKERIIPISIGFSETIRKYVTYSEQLRDGYLFVSVSGKKLYPKLLYRIVKRHLSKVTTILQKSPHVLRHSFATHMLNNGAELNAIKELLGHTSLMATEVYTHNSIEKLKSIYKQAHPRA